MKSQQRQIMEEHQHGEINRDLQQDIPVQHSTTRKRGGRSTATRGRGRGSTQEAMDAPKGSRGKRRGRPPGNRVPPKRTKVGGGSRRTFKKSGQISRNDLERIRLLRERKKAEIQRRVDQLSEMDARSLLKQVVERQPSLIFDVMAMQPEEEGPSPPQEHVPSWCVCGFCKDMPTELEQLCCGYTPSCCIAMSAYMDHYIVESNVLGLHIQYRDEVLANAVEGTNKAMRHAAYRLFVIWQYGRIGEGTRKVIPSCCVNKIRDRFPESSGQYIGYTPGRLS